MYMKKKEEIIAIVEQIKKLALSLLEPEKKKVNRFFINSRGEIRESLNPSSDKHKLRIGWGNAFETKEEAKAAKQKIKQFLISP